LVLLTAVVVSVPLARQAEVAGELAERARREAEEARAQVEEARRAEAAAKAETARVAEKRRQAEEAPPGFGLPGHTATVLVVAFSPDGRHLASGSADHTVIIWDGCTRRQVFKLNTGDQTGDVAFDRDGTRLAVANASGRTKILEAPTGKEVFRLAGAGCL